MRQPAAGLRARLAISISLILLVALGVTYFAVYQGTGSELRDRTENDLEREVESLGAELGRVPGSPDGATSKAMALVQNQPLEASSKVILITIDGGGIATNQPDLFDDEDSKEIAIAPSGFTSVKVDDVGEVRLLSRQFELPDGVVANIRVGQPLGSVDQALEGLSKTFLVVGIFSLLLAAAAGWLLANNATRPMRRMAEVAEGVDAGDLAARMPIGETHNDEVRSLAGSFNGMLDRVESAFARQQHFVADASHDLRTPLTIIKGQLQVLSRNPDPSREDLVRVTNLVEAASLRMERLIDDLLILAQVDSGNATALEAITLEPLVSAEVEAFRETSERTFEIRILADDGALVDREQLARAVSNLLSNAVKHTDPGGTIRVSVSEAKGQAVVAVEDDGPDVPTEMRSKVFDRFSRLDASRTSSGSGLGLAIVKAVAESQGGSASCDSSELGGARFRIFLRGAVVNGPGRW